MKNLIAIRRQLVVVPPGNSDNMLLAAAVQAELMGLGYILEPAALTAMSRAPEAWIIVYHSYIIPFLKQSLGANRHYRPIYPNFPAQVMELSHLELFVNAVLHYASDGKWEPHPELAARGIQFEKTNFTILRLATEVEFLDIFTRLASLPQSLSETDKQTIVWFVDTYGSSLTIPSDIPFKETLCILAAKGLNVPVKSATDVLRIAVYLSGGDISLPALPSAPKKRTLEETYPQWAHPYWEKTRPREWWDKWLVELQAQMESLWLQQRAEFKFARFKRPQRRFLLSLLEKTSLDVEEMQLRLGRWLRLGEILHVGEHAARFPKTAAAFDRLRNQTKTSRIRTFPARIYLAFSADTAQGIKLLSTRPGEYARRLDWMLRNFEPDVILATFSKIASSVSAKVLMELHSHFHSRHLPDIPRAIMIKGSRPRLRTLTSLPPMPQQLTVRVCDTIFDVCRARIAKLPPLGAVWVDPRLKNVPLPTAMRSVNTSIKTYIRGTRIPFNPNAKVIRTFLHWFDKDANQDLDLSVGLYRPDFKLASQISFTNLKIDAINCCHSGDIRHRQGSCAEYADIDINRCLDHNIRYAVVLAFNYDQRPMHTVKQCVFGLMEREFPQANEIFLPTTISNCMALANESTSVIVCILDLQTRDYVWADLESSGFPTFETTQFQTTSTLRALLQTPKFSIADLLSLHASARGSIAPTPQAAQSTFHWEDFITDYSKVASFSAF